MKLLLKRDYHGDDCTQGVLSLATSSETYSCQTMERPWIAAPRSRGGLSGKSCVPAGVYNLQTHSSEAHPRTWALMNPDLDVIHWEDKERPWLRALVLIHVANYVRELRGCIGVGRRRGVTADSTRAVWDSALAMSDLHRLLPWTNEHTLIIS